MPETPEELEMLELDILALNREFGDREFDYEDEDDYDEEGGEIKWGGEQKMNPIGEVIYLANPNKHPDPLVVRGRYLNVLEATSKLMEMEMIVYSPIVHMHHLKFSDSILREWNFFKRYDEAMLSRSNKLWILDLSGWDESDGVRGEIEIACEHNIPIALVSANQLLKHNRLLLTYFDAIVLLGGKK